MPYFITDDAPGCSGFATIKEDGEVIGCHATKQEAIDQMIAVSIAEDIEPGGERAPAPPSDQIVGSKKNPAGSAAGKQGGIEINETTETALKNKVADHNEKMTEGDRPVWTRVTLGVLKSVYRRGSGAYSTSHRPGVSRAAWSMARVNAFLYLARSGRPQNPKYITDNDLLHPDHPKYSKAERALPDNYRPALSEDVPEGRACGNCAFYNEDNVQGEGDNLKAYCERWDAYVDGGFYCNAWQPHEEGEEYEEEEEEMVRQVSLEIPVYIRNAARKGLDYYGQGLAGEGLVDRTVREARDMARGDITEDKVIRTNAWAQRHAVDLEAPKNSNASNDQFPGAGAVAHYLWGINPLNPQPARDWFERKANAIKDERGLFNFHRAKSEYFANIPGMEDNKVEMRRVNVNEFELRAGPTGDGMSFTGYAAVFNSDSEPLPFIERIAPGAFRKSLKGRNTIKMYMNHDSSMLLASTRSKTLRLEEDSKGLMVNADLPDTTVGRDLSVLMQRGDVDSMSFGFSVPSGGDKWSDDGMSRELRTVRLHEVSVVTGFPAYRATSATVRSLDVLAERAGVDVDKLAEAITVLEAGGTLTDESADLLSSAVSKLRAEPAVVPHSVNLLAKKLELLKNI